MAVRKHDRPGRQHPRRSLLVLIALCGSGVVRADLPEFGPSTLDQNFFRGNRFGWMDFDSIDAQVSWPTAADPDIPTSRFTPYVGGRVVSDDNLYRLPAANLVPGTVSIKSRSDVISTVSAGIDGHLIESGESLELAARVDENRYAHNASLDNTSASAGLLGQYTLGSRVSGELGASYDYQLTQFGRYYVLTSDFLIPKDLFTTYRYFAVTHVRVGSGWQLTAEATQVKTSHTDDPLDKYRGTSGVLSAEYNTPRGTSVTVAYRVENGRYGIPGFINDVIPFDRNFQERTASVRIAAPLGGRVFAAATGGYVTHDYPGDSANFDFAGAIWDVSLAVETGGKSQLLLTSARRVYAYVDAQSEYFVSQASRVIARWAPTSKFTSELQLSREAQRFLGPNPSTATFLVPQHTVIRFATINLAWSISRSLQMLVSYRLTSRNSNAPVFAYDDNLITASLQARF